MPLCSSSISCVGELKLVLVDTTGYLGCVLAQFSFNLEILWFWQKHYLHLGTPVMDTQCFAALPVALLMAPYFQCYMALSSGDIVTNICT